MKDLLKAIEDLREASYVSTGTIYTSDVVELIETMLAGKVIVPVEPTDEMIEAGRTAPISGGWTRQVYKAMLDKS